MKRFGLLMCVIGVLGCGPQPAPDTREADERAVRELEAEWSKTAGAKDVEGFVAYYADDAALLAPNAPIASGKEAVRATVKQLFSLPGFALSFQTVKVDVARSGDLAYSHGTYSLTANDAKGNPATEKGKYVTLFKKQADGKWKVVADTFNSDMPAAAPPAK